MHDSLRRDHTAFGQKNATAAIFWISVLGLYLELLLIRWIGTEIRIFAYLQNTVLVVCFLGLGVGLFTSREPVSPGRVAWPLALLAGVLFLPASREVMLDISAYLSVLGDVNIWYGGQANSPLLTAAGVAIGLILALIVMVLVVDMFIPIGRVLGELMDRHPRTILAYSVNVAGSLAGTWLFVLLSRLNQPPVVWFAVLYLLLIPLLLQRGRVSWPSAGALLLVVGLVWMGSRVDGAIRTVWSPYQKLSLWNGPDFSDLEARARYVVSVNNVGYQGMIDLREEVQRADPQSFPPRQLGMSQYDIPLLVHPRPEDVLIVGAGAGNDAAGALRHGAHRVTAVEIDPAIISLGRELHPERPYDSPRVRLVNDDARSFFATTDDRYDLIIFGLLDSHTTTAMTNARLDHYVYTLESIERARDLLAEDGVLALSFEAFKPFIADRIAVELQEVFGEDPIVFRIPGNSYGWGGVLFFAGELDVVRGQIEGSPRLSTLIEEWRRDYPVELTYRTPMATDDWPYLYLPERGIPPLFILLAGLVGLLVLHCRARVQNPVGLGPVGWSRSHWHFFFLGAAFLLLEVQNISKASVALGNTWLVNAVIISGVLAMVLVANMIVALRPRISMGPVYVALLATPALLYFIDLARFAFLPYGTKAVIVGGLSTLPMAFGGIVFIKSFTLVERKDMALGANLIGALVGALLQSLSFLTGIKSLLLLVAALYSFALLTRPEGAPVLRGVRRHRELDRFRIAEDTAVHTGS
ncbi:MAG: spermidine synthase [Gemmatimonadota bacterium]